MPTKYAQKLLDPRWQRKRLEVLEAADFRCQSCGDGESTLHVHHRQYFKGKEPWDYDKGQLEALCENCHDSWHEQVDELSLVTSYISSDGEFGRGECAGLLIGYTRTEVAHHESWCPYQIALGLLTRQISKTKNFSIYLTTDLADILYAKPEQAVAALKELVERFK